MLYEELRNGKGERGGERWERGEEGEGRGEVRGRKKGEREVKVQSSSSQIC